MKISIQHNLTGGQEVSVLDNGKVLASKSFDSENDHVPFIEVHLFNKIIYELRCLDQQRDRLNGEMLKLRMQLIDELTINNRSSPYKLFIIESDVITFLMWVDHNRYRQLVSDIKHLYPILMKHYKYKIPEREIDPVEWDKSHQLSQLIERGVNGHPLRDNSLRGSKIRNKKGEHK